ncbi:hypothetical protein NNO_1248 [Hydrogenimonas sp.]|nr:hypothetical protein NNO_1248 [Hydrogenimonas sp.]
MKRLFDARRRELLKRFGIGAGLLLSGGLNAAETKLSMPSSKRKARIVIAGGGTAGMAVAARIRRAAPNAQIILVSPNAQHLYQPGQLFTAAGLYRSSDNVQPTSGFLPDGVKWLRESVLFFDPESNSLKTDKSGKILYDFLIVATGCEYDFGAIEGLESSMIGKNGITSVYMNDTSKGVATGGELTRSWFSDIRKSAQSGHVKVLLADPDTPVKGEGVSLDILFLCNDMLKGNGPMKGSDLHAKAEFTLVKSSDRLIGNVGYDKVLKKMVGSEKNFSTLFSHRLISVDAERKIATFEFGGTGREVPYDFLHITPPMRASGVLRDSPLAAYEGEFKGWFDAEARTLRHKSYPNVFGVGDVLGTPFGKSGAAARDQAIVMQDNIAAALEEKPLPAKYLGYTAVPIRTRYGREMLAEYDEKGFDPTFPLDPTEPRWIWWEIDLHLMRWVYFNMIMRGMM